MVLVVQMELTLVYKIKIRGDGSSGVCSVTVSSGVGVILTVCYCDNVGQVILTFTLETLRYCFFGVQTSLSGESYRIRCYH